MLKSLKVLIALAGAALALVVGPAVASASTSFGADVNSSVEPSYSTSHNKCTGLAYLHAACTWVLDEGLGNVGGEKAPQSGKLERIKLIAGAPGSFRLQLVKVRDSDRAAKVITDGPKIHYQGQDGSSANGYEVEKFAIQGVHVHAGEQLAVAAKSTSAMQCGPMGSKTVGSSTIIYSPVLQVGNAIQGLGSANGCHLLIEGFVK
jgi:hypothetical protein